MLSRTKKFTTANRKQLYQLNVFARLEVQHYATTVTQQLLGLNRISYQGTHNECTREGRRERVSRTF